MAKKVYICDRCGKEKPRHVGVDVTVRSQFIRDVGWVRLCAGSGYERDVDLCEDCMKSFANWLVKLDS